MIWPIIGGLAALGAEILFRSAAPSGYITPHTVPAILLGIVVNFCIYKMLQYDTILGALVGFSLCTTSLRMVATWAMERQGVTLGQAVAWVLVLIATIAKRY